MDKVAIIGVAQTNYMKFNPKSHDEMVFEVTQKVLEDAQVTLKEVENSVTCTNDFWDGRTISSMTITDASGSFGVPTTNVEGDGTYGTLMGLMRISSGHFNTGLVVAQSKGSVGNPMVITNGMFDPIYDRILGLDVINSAALQARSYMARYGITEEQCAKVSVKNHKNAKNNPYAQMPLDLSVEEVLNSRVLSSPIKLLDTSPITDGACAIILANEAFAKERCPHPVWIKGIGHSTDTYHFGDRDLADTSVLKTAAQKAYRMAGIEDSSKEIDVAEIYDAFSYMELMWYEGLGFCSPGQGGFLIDSGKTEMTGPLAVNPSGGVLSAHPVLAAGLARVIEATLQLRGQAGLRQIDSAHIALAHGLEGACGQGHCVIILEK